MFIVAVEFKIHSANIHQFRETIFQQAANSLSDEADCHQFDVCFDAEDPTQCFLYEKYTDANAFEAHQKTAHFAQFCADAEPWIAAKQIKTWTCAHSGGAAIDPN